MIEGWVCPKCQRVYAPFVKECECCNKAALPPPFTPLIPPLGGYKCPVCGSPYCGGVHVVSQTSCQKEAKQPAVFNCCN